MTLGEDLSTLKIVYPCPEFLLPERTEEVK